MARQFETRPDQSPAALGSMLAEFQDILTQRIHDAVTTLDTRQNVWKETILRLQEQVQEQEKHLADKIKDHDHRVLKAETTLAEWEQMLIEQEERLETKEAAFITRLQETERDLRQQSMQQLDESFEECKSTRILEAASEWEDHILTKAEEVMKDIEQRLEESTTLQMQAYMDQVEETARQRQLRTKAWMEVAATQTLDTLTEKLKNFHDVQHAKIEEFVTVQTQNLQMDLDEFRFHAQETLHAGIFGPDMPNPRARYVEPPSRAIPVEETEDPLQRRAETTRDTSTTHGLASGKEMHQPSMATPVGHDTAGMSTSSHASSPPLPTTPKHPEVPTETTRTPRWRNVDYDALRAHPTRSPPIPMEARVHRQSQEQQKSLAQDTREDYIARLRKTPTPMQLRGQERQAVVTWYNSFVDFLKTYRVPIKIFEEFQLHKLDDPKEVLYPPTLNDPHLYDRYSAAIYARLEADDVLDPDNQVYMGLLRLHNSTRDGYTMLKAILASTLLADVRNISVLSTPPVALPGTCPFAYAASLKEFFEHQAQLQRKYHPREQALMYLQALQPETKYTAAAMQLIQDLEHLQNEDVLPDKYTFNHLPVALVTHQGVLRAPAEATATLNVTHSRPIGQPMEEHHHEMDAPPAPYRSSQPRTPAVRGPPRYRSSPQYGTRGQARSPSHPAQNRAIQCDSCGTNGHSMEVCKILPRVYACMEFIGARPTEAMEALQQHRKNNHPATQRQSRDRLVNVLRGEILLRQQADGDGWWDDIDSIVEHVTDQFHSGRGDFSEDTDEYRPSIYQAQVVEKRRDRDLDMELAEMGNTIQPVRFPFWEIHGEDVGCGACVAEEDIPPDPAVVKPGNDFSLQDSVEQLEDDPQETPDDEDNGPRMITLITTRLELRRDLADTGASISATGIRSILHQFQTHSDYQIKGYDGQVTKAAGQGYAHIYNPETQQTDEMLFVYTPAVKGTIISLEHHARTHPRIHRWTQEATPSDDKGRITFLAKDGAIVSTYNTIRAGGLYYIQDLNFIPASETETHSKGAEGIDFGDQDAYGGGIQDMNMFHLAEETDYTPTLDTEHQQYLLGDQITPSNPICVAQVEHPTVKVAKEVSQYELWHQRMGHAPAPRLQQTAKQVHGLPQMNAQRIPPFVRCRACDIAKLKKAPKGQVLRDSPTLQNGQCFHMDIGFLRGPANLPAVVDRREDVQPKVINSRHNYVCYLLVVDRKSRYMWAFPLRSRSVPMELMETFLNIHGNTQAMPRTVRTDGEGSLAESVVFRRLLGRAGYVLEKTATDTSSQNGIVERPHQTLGNMVRCMLFAAAMPVEFWADALVYAVYVSNRLFHSGTERIPYNAWTGRRASVAHLRVFGAHVTVRRSGTRPTKLDPHFYTGRFLRFGATAKNLVYYDEVTKREKVARHCTMDELHYGSSPLTRPPMANTIIDTYLSRHQPAEPDHGLLVHDNSPGLHLQDLDKVQRIPDTQRHEEFPQTATAATLYAQMTARDQQQERTLRVEYTTDNFLPPVSIHLPMNLHPTLGLLLTDSRLQEETIISGCQEGTAASRLPRWRSQIKGSTVREVEGHGVTHRQGFITTVANLRRNKVRKVKIVVAKHAVSAIPCDDVPQLHYDQLRHIHQVTSNPEADIVVITLTRAQLKKTPEFHHWVQGEWAQHNKYRQQDMFGTPIPRPKGAIVLPFVWAYSTKIDPTTGDIIYKARCTCNGGKRFGRAVTMAETYATCVAQPACRLYWAIVAAAGLIALGADAANAFAEAPPPVEPFYMKIDIQFREWWTQCLGNPPIPEDYVLPVQHALQGHPEAPRLWETHIHAILVEHLKFVPTTHEKCLYVKRDLRTNDLQLLLRQVDDFSVAAKDHATCLETITQVGSFLQVPLNDLGLIKKFNGVNILQTKWFVKVSCEDYLTRILTDHAWRDLKASNLPVPMRSDPGYQRQLETASRPRNEAEQLVIQQQAGFSYRTATGELIYALVAARPDISFATTKATQFGSSPALVHYQAVKAIFAFLNNTLTDGLIFWRRSPRDDLPDVPFPALRSNQLDTLPPLRTDPYAPVTFSDSDWGADTLHRRSVSGIIIMVAGAAVIYKTHYQKAVALSSTEAEFVSASDAGKMALYVRSLLQDLGFSQEATPTPLHIDNRGALHMVTAGASTKRTRHVDIRYFALLQWAESGQLCARPIPTSHNISDSLTKATGRIKFHQHADIYMGRQRPQYAPQPQSQSSSLTSGQLTSLHAIRIRMGCIPVSHQFDISMVEISAQHFPIISALHFPIIRQSNSAVDSTVQSTGG